MGGWVNFWNWLLLGLTVFVIFGMLSVYSEASEDCDGTVVKNYWGWPTCVETPAK